MKILCSACLLGENCKYNGGNNKHQKLVELQKDHTLIAVCPEVLGGLSIPRESAEIVDGFVRNKNGNSVDKEFRFGAKEALEIALKERIDLAILQSRSPSCGVKQIYDGSFSGKLIEGEGIFAKLLMEHEIPLIDVEDLEKINLKEEKV